MFLYSLLAFWCCYEVKHYIISQGLPSTYWLETLLCVCAVLDFSFLAAGAAVVPTGWPFSSAHSQWQRLATTQICAHLSRALAHFRRRTHRQAKSVRMRNSQLRELSCGERGALDAGRHSALGVRATRVEHSAVSVSDLKWNGVRHLVALFDAIAQIVESETLAALLGGVAMATHCQRVSWAPLPLAHPPNHPPARREEKCIEPLTHFSRCRLWSWPISRAHKDTQLIFDGINLVCMAADALFSGEASDSVSVNGFIFHLMPPREGVNHFDPRRPFHFGLWRTGKQEMDLTWLLPPPDSLAWCNRFAANRGLLSHTLCRCSTRGMLSRRWIKCCFLSRCKASHRLQWALDDAHRRWRAPLFPSRLWKLDLLIPS